MSATTILVVDDLEANCRLLDAVLTGRGFGVVLALSGQDALDVLDESSVDLVLVDVNMPGMDGYEVCRRIRRNPATEMLPVIMITAATNEERVQAIEAGADDFILRPFDQAELLARVRSLLRIKAYHDTLVGQAAELSAFNQTLEERVQEHVEELAELRRLRRFLPQPLAAALASAEATELLEPHRREVAVCVAELRGLSGYSSTSAPEDAAETLRAFHEAVGRVVSRHGASVGAFSGESVMLFFNDPVACDDAAQKATALALDLIHEVQVLGKEWERIGSPIAVSAGIGLGYATIGMFGFEGRWDYSVIGPVVAQAEALCRNAAAGDVLLSQRAVATLDPELQTVRDDDVRARGIPEPVSAWRVTASGDPQPARVRPRPNRPTAELEISLLGPVELYCLGREVELSSPKERALLVLLATRVGKPITVERLAEELWEGALPDSAIASLRVYVSRLRKALSASGAEGVLVTKPSGYELRMSAESIDSVRFEGLTKDGIALARAGEFARGAATLAHALDLWRGDALVDAAGSPMARSDAVRLEERKLVCIEERIHCDLELDQHDLVVAELESLTLAHPLRERLWSQRMVALARSRRQPEALRAYQDMRRMLGEELGLEPSPDLVKLERAITAGNTAEVVPLTH